MSPSTKRSIGQILPLLRSEFPDISISKIRYLESEGLVAPERAPSGYRRYAEADIERLRYILRMQRDHYLPLKVIREHLDLMDQGKTPPAADALPASGEPSPSSTSPDSSQSPSPTKERRPIKVTRRELLKMSGIPEAMLIEMERQRMVMPRRGSMYYGREALTLCVVARKLQEYGMGTLHLRAIKYAAQQEAGLVEQVMAPHAGRGAETARLVHELSQLIVHAHASVLYTMLER